MGTLCDLQRESCFEEGHVFRGFDRGSLWGSTGMEAVAQVATAVCRSKPDAESPAAWPRCPSHLWEGSLDLHVALPVLGGS